MQSGDKVTLQKKLGPYEPGCEGIIKHIDSQMNVTVELFHDPKCNQLKALLPPVAMHYYSPGTRCS